MVERAPLLPDKNDDFFRIPAHLWEIDRKDASSLTGRCANWDKDVAPLIARDGDRVDKLWRWRRIAMIAFGLGALRGPRLFQMTIGDERCPAAMLALLANERWFENPETPATFLWYLSTAPESAIHVRINDTIVMPKLVGLAAMYYALRVAAQGPSNGRLWLHADPAGDASGLSDWYQNAAGMKKVSQDQFPKLPGAFIAGGRVNDGRYFCYDEVLAKVALENMNSKFWI